MFCRSSQTSCILRDCLLLQLIPSNLMTQISLAVWRARTICQLIFLSLPKDENLLNSAELLIKVPFLTGLGVVLGSFLATVSSTACRPALLSQLSSQISPFVMRKKPQYMPLFLIGRIKERYSIFLDTQKI